MVVWAIEKWKKYLDGRKFVLLTGNRVLSRMMTFRDVIISGSLLSGYDFTEKYA